MFEHWPNGANSPINEEKLWNNVGQNHNTNHQSIDCWKTLIAFLLHSTTLPPPCSLGKWSVFPVLVIYGEIPETIFTYFDFISLATASLVRFVSPEYRRVHVLTNSVIFSFYIGISMCGDFFRYKYLKLSSQRFIQTKFS